MKVFRFYFGEYEDIYPVLVAANSEQEARNIVSKSESEDDYVEKRMKLEHPNCGEEHVEYCKAKYREEYKHNFSDVREYPFKVNVRKPRILVEDD